MRLSAAAAQRGPAAARFPSQPRSPPNLLRPIASAWRSVAAHDRATLSPVVLLAGSFECPDGSYSHDRIRVFAGTKGASASATKGALDRRWPNDCFDANAIASSATTGAVAVGDMATAGCTTSALTRVSHLTFLTGPGAGATTAGEPATTASCHGPTALVAGLVRPARRLLVRLVAATDTLLRLDRAVAVLSIDDGPSGPVANRKSLIPR
jgi:hypothetical protein